MITSTEIVPVQFIDIAVTADGITGRGRETDIDAATDKAAQLFAIAIVNGFKSVTVKATEHRHSDADVCESVTDKYRPGMTECYRWSHDRAYYGV